MNPSKGAAWLVLLAAACASPEGDDTGSDDTGDELLDPDEQNPTTCTIDASGTGSSQATITIDTSAGTVACTSAPTADEGLQISAYSGSETWSFSTNVPLAEVQDCGGHEYYSASYGTAAYEAWVSCTYVAADGGDMELTFRVVVVDAYTNEAQVFEGRGVPPDTGTR